MRNLLVYFALFGLAWVAFAQNPPEKPKPDSRFHRTAPAPAKAHDGRITTAAPNVRWATDGAKMWTVDEGWLWLFTTT